MPHLSRREFILGSAGLALSPLAAPGATGAPAAPAVPAPVDSQTEHPARSGGSPARQRLVLCWYMVCFGNSVEGYRQEIELAQRHGIDGFLLDVGAWMTGSPQQLKPTNYVESAERLYEAARQLDSGFKLAMCPEYSVQPFPENVHDMVLRFKDHPNQLHDNGRPVLSGYGDAGLFQSAIDRLKTDGVSICHVPSVFFPRFVYNPSYEEFQELFTAAPGLDGLMMFNAEQLSNIITDNATGRRVTRRMGKTFAAGVIPAYNSANLQDYHGLSGYLAMWRGAIDDGADWISIVTWNDYNEDSALMPMRWPAGAERYQFNRDESFLHATALMSAWFKTGREPVISQDTLFVTYRNRSKWLRKGWDGKQWIDICLGGGRYDQIHDDVQDRVYVDTLLTSPASLTVDLGRGVHRFDMPAGIGHAEIPLVPGVPRVTLKRANQLLAEVVGRRQIIEHATERNSLVGTHHVNRTWACGTAIGPVAHRLEAATGTLSAGASVVTEAGVKAVRNAESRDSGFSVKVIGLHTATYNIRITYCNPSEEDARLTLFADGPPRAAGDFPYFIPAFLPPTGHGVFRTVSFFWSLYETTHTLSLKWTPGQEWGRPDPADDDYGSVLVQAIELVQVQPILPQHAGSLPDMVRVPGGSFSMGSEKGEPDELPRRHVTLAAFVMGRNLVTNEEFEQFDPSHVPFRDGNSWRDRSPVVHVSWVDAVRYCLWLSARHGLEPVYSEQALDPAKPGEKTWTANLQADGFRLPTEAEWEYAASGRGENRTYPWGEAAPVPGMHGRFEGARDSGARLPRPASQEGGACVVGSYPAGASRDGILDLAGNAAEWCTDWYGPYPAANQVNPCQQQPGNYRVIRGGSWGWYASSQRAADREFNSPNYPGHAYYGLRLAVSEAGWQKLLAANSA